MRFAEINALFIEDGKLSKYFNSGYALAQLVEEAAILTGKLSQTTELVFRVYMLSF